VRPPLDQQSFHPFRGGSSSTKNAISAPAIQHFVAMSEFRSCLRSSIKLRTPEPFKEPRRS